MYKRQVFGGAVAEEGESFLELHSTAVVLVDKMVLQEQPPVVPVVAAGVPMVAQAFKELEVLVVLVLKALLQ